MNYILVALEDVDEERMQGVFGALSSRGLRVVYDDDAPRAWVVSYDGTPKQLADLLWPDDVDKEQYVIGAGLVIRAPRANINGYVFSDFWDLFPQDKS